VCWNSSCIFFVSSSVGRSFSWACICTYSISVASQALTVIFMDGTPDRGSSPLMSFLSIVTPGLGFAALCSFLHFSLPFPSPLFLPASIGFGASIVVLNPYPPRLALCSILLRSWRFREVFPRDCAHFPTRRRPRVHRWHLAATGYCTPRAARSAQGGGIYECSAIHSWRLCGVVGDGAVFHNRSPAVVAERYWMC